MTDTERYNRDWDDLCERLCVAWPEEPFAHCRRLPQIEAAVRARPDAALAALVRRAQAGDRLAGRVVVQAMLGKLVRMSRSDATAHLDDYVAALWIVVMRYPIGRRRGSVAGGLALDTLKFIVRHRPGSLAYAEPPAPEAPPDAEAVAVIHRAADLGLLDEFTCQLLRRVYVEGETSAEAGAESGLSAAAVRQRCSQAVRRLARHRHELAA